MDSSHKSHKSKSAKRTIIEIAEDVSKFLRISPEYPLTLEQMQWLDSEEFILGLSYEISHGDGVQCLESILRKFFRAFPISMITVTDDENISLRAVERKGAFHVAKQELERRKGLLVSVFIISALSRRSPKKVKSFFESIGEGSCADAQGLPRFHQSTRVNQSFETQQALTSIHEYLDYFAKDPSESSRKRKRTAASTEFDLLLSSFKQLTPSEDTNMTPRPYKKANFDTDATPSKSRSKAHSRPLESSHKADTWAMSDMLTPLPSRRGSCNALL